MPGHIDTKIRAEVDNSGPRRLNRETFSPLSDMRLQCAEYGPGSHGRDYFERGRRAHRDRGATSKIHSQLTAGQADFVSRMDGGVAVATILDEPAAVFG